MPGGPRAPRSPGTPCKKRVKESKKTTTYVIDVYFCSFYCGMLFPLCFQLSSLDRMNRIWKKSFLRPASLLRPLWFCFSAWAMTIDIWSLCWTTRQTPYTSQTPSTSALLPSHQQHLFFHLAPTWKKNITLKGYRYLIHIFNIVFLTV